jgi:alpha-galactosidase
MTFREHIEFLPEPYRSKMLVNTEQETLDSEANEYHEHSKAGIVASAFTWDNTPEGFNYWRDFYRELDKKEHQV